MSRLFTTRRYQEIARAVVPLINRGIGRLSPRILSSTRAVGDTIQVFLSRHFGELLLESEKRQYWSHFPRRAMADFAFQDKEDFYYAVDVKTHRLEPGLHMPNLISVKRLTTFYENDKHYFAVLIIKYLLENGQLHVREAHFAPIEFFSWECLTIGALGWGQIQLRNADQIAWVPANSSRKQWMLTLCEKALIFYLQEIRKIQKRRRHFQRIYRFWDEREP
jgi:hypothetical protein